jgi:hypothetical protein
MSPNKGSFSFSGSNAMSGANKHAVGVVQSYILKLDTFAIWQGCTFKELSYSKWAANELLKCLEEQQEIPPLLVMESFRDKMDEYSHLNQKFGFVFSDARDVTEDIIEYLLS